MNLRVLFLLVAFLSACTSSIGPQPERISGAAQTPELPDLGEAPEFDNDVWLNTDHPLQMADLRGKVVLVDMWTFG
jgi:hypothetical protein